MSKTVVTTPDWVPDAVFYQIFPDRFAKSTGARSGRALNLEAWDSPPTRQGFKGGDLWGVLEKLDYLQDLGVNALYFCPIFQSAANHRYHTHDYGQVDPILGGNEALRALLDAAHARGMRVVLDGVFNHASRGFFPFSHVLENGPTSPYVDWFSIEGYPLRAYSRKKPPQYACWWGLRELPKLNTANPAVRDFIFAVARRWIEFGVDGWRLDVPGDIDDDEFWREFRRVVKETNPQAYIVGEIWDEGQRWLQGDQFDAVMNYVWSRAVLGFTLGRNLPPGLRPGGYEIAPLNARQFAAEIERILALYPSAITYAQLNLLGSHDTARFLTLAGGETARLRIATLLLMTYPGAPCIYYGDEIGLQGGPDPACRAAFPWDETLWDQELLEHTRRLIALRHELAPLRRGDLLSLYSAKKRNVYAFARRYQGETVLVTVNCGQRKFKRPIPLGDYVDWPDGTRLLNCLSGEASGEVQGGKVVGLKLAPLSGAILTKLKISESADSQIWYLYLLALRDGVTYTGITTDPRRRLAEHNAGRGSRFTRPQTRRPARLLGCWRFADRSSATSAEARFKRLRATRKRQLAAEQLPFGDAPFCAEYVADEAEE
jgi:cyclomaltodextrinase